MRSPGCASCWTTRCSSGAATTWCRPRSRARSPRTSRPRSADWNSSCSAPASSTPPPASARSPSRCASSTSCRSCPLLIERVQREAPHIDISVVRIDRRDLEEDLQSGEIDLAFDVGLPLSHDVRRERMTAEPLAVLARSDHPSIQGALTTEVVPGDGARADHGPSARRRLRRHRARPPRHVAPDPRALPALCGGERSLSRSPTCSRRWRAARRELGSRQGGTQVLPFPVEIPPLEMFLYWHANVDADPGSQWLRGLLLELLPK